MVLFLFSCTSKTDNSSIAKTITVDKGGNGGFSSVQRAIDSVPSNKKEWTLISVKSGIYNEKVVVPEDKPFIILVGESIKKTLIQWGDHGSSNLSATFTLRADNFVAMNLSFQNTYNLDTPDLDDRNTILWAPAATIYGDKASFYLCGFVGVQDTLTDALGRHFFVSCYIQGTIDFIWGKGQSVYKNCVFNATTGMLGGRAGYITAQGRANSNDPSGFVFLSGFIYSTGPVYLGRAYNQYSRVVFKNTYMSIVVQPKGWSSWGFVGKEADIVYSEVSCLGPGAKMSQRVKWEKKLLTEDLKKLTDLNKFINEDGWIQGQPRLK
ncbi:probable pectinesterase 29 [Hevea brasiliensis]|uniref:probable pectinesterase 29 n=1 Tax=Hevea brasiliensis TaxID=3981 RepID=UPI0025E4915D|nr:probable pectinesterase 29 [Hevea brasiliensis]